MKLRQVKSYAQVTQLEWLEPRLNGQLNLEFEAPHSN